LLKKITGFFAIELNMAHTLPHLFSQDNLKAIWSSTQISLAKMLEMAMGTSELEEMVELKRSFFTFSLCMQD